MDVSDMDSKPETTQEAESIAVDELVSETAKDQNVDPAEDFADETRENSEKMDVVLVQLLESTKPVESLSEELTQVSEVPVETEPSFGEANGVSEAVIDSVTKETDSMSGQNGHSDPTPSQVLEGVDSDPALDETNGVSSKENTLPDSVDACLPKSLDVGESDAPEVPHSTGNQVGEFCSDYVAVTPLSLQRTSWRDCCGLFHVLRRRSDQ